MGGLQNSDLDHPGRPPLDGQDRRSPPTWPSTRPRPNLRSNGNEARSSASSRSRCRPSSWPRVFSPTSRRSPRTRSAAASSRTPTSTQFREAASQAHPTPALHGADTAALSIGAHPHARAPPQAPAQPRHARHRLPAARHGLGPVRRRAEPRPRDFRDHDAASRPSRRNLKVPVLALSQLSRAIESTRQQAPAAFRPARIRLHRAGRRRRHVRLPRGILPSARRSAHAGMGEGGDKFFAAPRRLGRGAQGYFFQITSPNASSPSSVTDPSAP